VRDTPAATTVAAMADELSRLRNEVSVLREEGEILKKAAVGSDAQRNTAADGVEVWDWRWRNACARSCGSLH
jgi:transposase-like protein